jgi:CRISPR-associated endoribonuclease Cas6
LIETYVFKAVSSTSIGLGTYSGIVVRGIFFKILKCFNPSLATKVHEQRTLSPYSISPLENTERSQVFFDHVPGGLDFQFRIVAFQKDISEAVKRFVLSGDIPRINIHGITLPVNSVHVNSIEHDFSEKASSESTRFMVEFRSPTFFRNTQKRQGLLRLMIPSRFRRPVRPVYRYIIVPDPYYFFRGLARLYRQFCNPHFRYKSYCEWLLEGGVALETYYDLRVVKIWTNNRRWWRGFIGRAVFAIPKDLYDLKMAKLTHILLEFARYSNAGGNRTAGFGVVDYHAMNDGVHGRHDFASDAV